MHLYGTSPRTAQVALSLVYDAFGGSSFYSAYGSYSNAYNPVNFGGQFGYYKEYSGQYLLGHRYYNAALGRFLTRDPIGYGGGLNLYGYTGNNPVNESDPDGFRPHTWWDVLLDPFGLNDSVDRAQANTTKFLEKNPKARSVNDFVMWGLENIPVDGGGPQLGTMKSASEALPMFRGKATSILGKMLGKAGFRKVKVSSSAAKNETWAHPDGSEVMIHPYGDLKTGTFRTGNNGHVHKYGPGGVKLNDRGLPDTDPNETHIGIPNPADLPTIRGRPHGTGNK